MRGASIIMKSLETLGVDVVFGFPGGQVLPLYDALLDSNVRHVLVRHEQAAAHAADGYARASGRTGVCFATSGPGATNLVTGLATAFMDSIPLVAITGQVGVGLLGRDSFQEADISGITIPITKHNYIVKNPADLARTICEAFHIASTGRHGPVLIDVPKDVQAAETEFVWPQSLDLPGYRPRIEPDPTQVAAAATVMLSAKAPLIYAGGGVVASGASADLQALAGYLQAPVTTTLMGLGAVPYDSPLFLGMPGMHGTRAANRAIQECDVLVAVGARFDDRVTGRVDRFAPNARIVHVDIDRAEMGKNVRVDFPVLGDARACLRALLERIQEMRPATGGLACAAGCSEGTGVVTYPGRAAWLSRLASFKRNGNGKKPPSVNGHSPRPARVLRDLMEIAGEEAVITTDVGQHQMWVALYYGFTRPRTLLTSGGLGTMGYGLPAAVGAQVARPGSRVVLVSGDGSFLMNSQELATVAANRLPLKMIVFNNGCLGMVRQWQELFYRRRYSQVALDGSPDLVKLAGAYGIQGMRVAKPARVAPALREAFETPGPVLVDLVLDTEENVFPMVPPAASLDEMIEGPGSVN